MVPTWLTTAAWLYIGVSLVCAGVILHDIMVNRRRQAMAVMNWVFPITALYFGPLALAFYWRWARAAPRPPTRPVTPTPVPIPQMAMASTAPGGSGPGGSGPGGSGPGGSAPFNADRADSPGRDPVREDAGDDHAQPSRPRWVTMAIETSHCGSGCTLGDFISEWIIFAFGITIAGYTIFAEYVGDYLLAVAFGIVFQYFAIAPMLGLGLRDGLKAAAKADFISLTFFEIGLFAWMALMTFVFFPAPNNLMPNQIAFWFLMQIGMIIGYFTSWPANVWLVNRGIKVPM